MSRETWVAFYFWMMLICGLLLSLEDKSIEAAIHIAAAAIIGVLNLNARDRE